MSGLFATSTDSRARERRAPGRRGEKRELRARERGVALILAMTAIAILSVMLADMHEATGASYALATSQRDRLRAEYLAKSGMALTRLLVAAEPQIRQAVTPFYQGLTGRAPPQIPIWSFADDVLAPFCNYEQSQGLGASIGIDFTAAEGLGETGGRCQIIGFAENSRINLNEPLHMEGDEARLSAAQQVYAMIGGYQAPSPYDPFFERRDADGQLTSRLDIVSALIDWWDPDSQRTTFDPGAATVDSNSGAEDDIYQSFRDPYRVRNAPLDSLEELRLIRGVGDDFWATFVEPDPDDPSSRSVTIYGSGKVNPNEARPEVLLARTCSILVDQTLCTDPAEAAKFIQLMNTVRAMAPIPWFSRVEDFADFLQGRGNGQALYPMLQGMSAMIPAIQSLLFRPVTIAPDRLGRFHRVLVFGASIITVQSTAWVGNCEGRADEGFPEDCTDGADNDGDGDVDCDDGGCGASCGEETDGSDPILARCTRVRVRSVLNFDTRWVPPPPNAGALPRTGVVHHWRVD